MEITPPLGIGDLLILKMHILSNNINISQINLNEKKIYFYRLHPEKYKKFLIIFINKLFPNTKINIIEDNKDFDRIKYNIKSTYLYDKYNFNKENIINFKNTYGEYIVFHTKGRFDYINNFIKTHNDILINFFSNFKSKYKILLLGEKKVENNFEVQNQPIFSFYDIMLLMKNKNEVIDLTYDELYSGNNIDDFEKDLLIINNAKLNIGFGLGGPLNICQSFSKNSIFYINKYVYDVLEMYKIINNNIFIDFNEFVEQISKFIE